MPTLMVQGCTSDAGKTTLVAGLCRLLARQGRSVAPFKPQNMALNSAVTEDGGEIGRAQALQAAAAKIKPTVDMNPVLLKPNSDTGAQVIIQGQAIGQLDAQNYHQFKPKAAQAVFDSFQKLTQQYDTILVEGAGSPAEVNLREGDIANMGFAEEVDCPVILIADIDKGGVFAHLVGTLACLSASEKDRIKGFVINRFRGDFKLLKPGIEWLESKTGKPVLATLPYLHGLHLDQEDAIQVRENTKPGNFSKFKVVVPLLPHISNHTDFDPLLQHPDIHFQFVKHDESIPPADLVILPGSKNIAFDLDWLKSQGWPPYLKKHLRYGGKVIGICGGLQMLGREIQDPQHLESNHKKITGLGFFDYTTVLKADKTLKQVKGKLFNSVDIDGYEIHHGQTDFGALKSPITTDVQLPEGALSADNQILVTYWHGLFNQPQALQALLKWAGLQTDTLFDHNQQREQQLERLADTIESCIDLRRHLTTD